MFASQWFLTLYTAKFPLFMVFHYLDLFLLTGVDSVFQVAMALLQVSSQALLIVTLIKNLYKCYDLANKIRLHWILKIEAITI